MIGKIGQARRRPAEPTGRRRCLENRVGRGAISEALLAGGCLLMAGAVLATLQRIYQHWKDKSR